MRISLGELTTLTGGELDGDPSFVIEGAAGLEEAAGSDISFLGNPKYAAQTARSRAGAVFLPRSAKGSLSPAGASGPRNRVYVDDPQWAFAQVLARLEAESQKPSPAVLSPKAEIHYEARLGPNVGVGPFAVIERQAVVGEGTSIGPQCFIGHGAQVGKNCRIYPQVVIRENCVIGDRVIIHSGTVIGSDGYGFSTDLKTGTHRKIPQIGNVVVEDDVEIGSNVSVDRATVGATRIGAGTKIDNLVQLAHNVQIGKDCLIISQVGVAGSTKVGNHVVLAGQAGIPGHLVIGDGAVITAQTGVIADVESKAVMFGSPARPHREAMRLHALFGRLPELFDAVKEIKARLAQAGGHKIGERP